jgi:hypothetical protein
MITLQKGQSVPGYPEYVVVDDITCDPAMLIGVALRSNPDAVIVAFQANYISTGENVETENTP